MTVAPLRKRLTFCVGSIQCGDSHDIGNAKRPQLAYLRRGLIVIRETPADELVIWSRVRKDRDSL
jgi:hypothetical protein